MPSRAVPASLDRRDLLIGIGRGAAGLLLVTVTASACGTSTPEIDPLQAPLDQATADAELARAAITAAPPPLAPALTVIADERTEHARALALEIARAAGLSAPSATTTTTTTSPAGGTAAPPPSVADVVAALRASATDAGTLTATQSGYRAGLLGSISAACTAGYAVGLNAPRPKR